MENLKIKYFGLYLTKKKYLQLFFLYLAFNIIGFLYFTFYPLNPDDFSIGKFLARHLNLIFLIFMVYTIIEGQFFWNRFTKKQLETIEKLKQNLEEKNNDIISSMRYARRIQNSLMPTEKYIEKNMSNLRWRKIIKNKSI